MREPMYGLSLDWETCPAGVEWHERPASPDARPPSILGQVGDLGFRGYRYLTDDRVRSVKRMKNLENPVVLRFINAKCDGHSRDGMAKFVAANGFPRRPFLGAEDATFLTGEQDRLRNLIKVAGVGEASEAIRGVNDLLSRHAFKFAPMLPAMTPLPPAPGDAPPGLPLGPDPLRLVPRLEYPIDPQEDAAPRLMLAAGDLYDYMTMECAFVAMVGARTASCEHCGNIYLTGPLTGRRSHSLYCSDSCRVLAMRKRRSSADAA